MSVLMFKTLLFKEGLSNIRRRGALLGAYRDRKNL
jgi:hypothetical protein